MRPRLFALVATIVLLAAVAIAFAVAPPMAGRSALTDLSLPAILTAGFLDGFNPCAFGVLILFATFALGLAARQSVGEGQSMPVIRSASRSVIGLGAFFVAGVLVTYLLIGLGLLAAVVSAANFGTNHLPSRIAALVAIALGLWMVRDVLLPGASWKLQAPHALHGRMRDWARSSSPVALFAGGILIGLCTVPCSGAVYLGVVALLGASGTFASGLGGLVLYNVAYITPLVALLFMASRPGLIRTINRWHLQHSTGTKAVLAFVVLALGFAILLTV